MRQRLFFSITVACALLAGMSNEARAAAAKPIGPELDGFRIGMTIPEALAIIKDRDLRPKIDSYTVGVADKDTTAITFMVNNNGGIFEDTLRFSPVDHQLYMISMADKNSLANSAQTRRLIDAGNRKWGPVIALQLPHRSHSVEGWGVVTGNYATYGEHTDLDGVKQGGNGVSRGGITLINAQRGQAVSAWIENRTRGSVPRI